ncbi:unnamed protein product [Symbiodinium necroappetens]|uniref:Uncharacterized protein n=1 Tax=Symbiodinium necroappetens TaxID=1628268 RepID=A0A813BBX4_9DINO|nr:unnamed protein product [Symbiodinium necroappetens]
MPMTTLWQMPMPVLYTPSPLDLGPMTKAVHGIGLSVHLHKQPCNSSQLSKQPWKSESYAMSPDVVAEALATAALGAEADKSEPLEVILSRLDESKRQTLLPGQFPMEAGEVSAFAVSRMPRRQIAGSGPGLARHPKPFSPARTTGGAFLSSGHLPQRDLTSWEQQKAIMPERSWSQSAITCVVRDGSMSAPASPQRMRCIFTKTQSHGSFATRPAETAEGFFDDVRVLRSRGVVDSQQGIAGAAVPKSIGSDEVADGASESPSAWYAPITRIDTEVRLPGVQPQGRAVHDRSNAAKAWRTKADAAVGQHCQKFIRFGVDILPCSLLFRWQSHALRLWSIGRLGGLLWADGFSLQLRAMALARQLRRSLAGLGAYSLCLLGILLGPSGHLGGMFGPFIAVVSITLICASGVYVVHIMSKTFSSQESAGQHVVLAFVWLIVLAVMLAVGMGPTQVAVELNLVSDLHGVSVCNWSDWSDTGGGVFFRDGSTLLGDSREELPISHVTVDKCCVSATLNCRELHLEGIKPLRVVHETQEAGKRPVELQPDSVDQASGGLLWEGALDLARHLAEGGLERSEGTAVADMQHELVVEVNETRESTLRHITAANCAANDIQIGLPDETGVSAH